MDYVAGNSDVIHIDISRLHYLDSCIVDMVNIFEMQENFFFDSISFIKEKQHETAIESTLVVMLYCNCHDVRKEK